MSPSPKSRSWMILGLGAAALAALAGLVFGQQSAQPAAATTTRQTPPPPPILSGNLPLKLVKGPIPTQVTFDGSTLVMQSLYAPVVWKKFRLGVE